MQLLFRSEIQQFVVQFRDYMRAQYGIELSISEEKNDLGVDCLSIYIDVNDPNYDKIKQEYALYLNNLFDPRYAQASWQAGDHSTYHPKNTHSISPKKIEQQIIQQGKFTLFMTIICSIVYGLSLTGHENQLYQLFHYPADVSEQDQLWRYVGHSIVHLSLWHFLFNLSFWWIFGGAIERTFDSINLIMLYLISAVASGIAQNFATGPAFFGLSGVVYAVLGFVSITNKFNSQKIFDLPSGFFNMIIIGIAVGFISPIFEIYMGNAAHITGLLTGLLFGLLHLPKSAQREKE